MADAYVNFLGGSPLNRLSWLRTSPVFLKATAAALSARWVLFQNGHPLMASSSSKSALARLPTAPLLSVIGPLPIFGQGQKEGEHAADGVSVLEASRLRGPPIVFLGLDEPTSYTEGHRSSAGSGALPSSEFSAKTEGGAEIAEKVKGTPFFALDVSAVPEDDVKKMLAEAKADATLEFTEPRAAMGKMDGYDAALFSEARSMLDWNTRNKFCPSCGSTVYSLWAGWKLSCSSLLPWAENGDRTPCASGKGIHNFAHPRSDPVVIMLCVDETGEKILMGHNRKFPGKFYSALAGFMEPGETFEDAVKREIWEEAGVSVWNVRYHSTQPWPFPANVMIGFYATADSSQPIRTDLDNELEDARWFSREEVLAVLAHRDGTNLSKRHPGGGSGAFAHSDPSIKHRINESGQQEEDSPPFVVPPKTAIAGVLISEWAHGRVKHLPQAEHQRGNL